MNLPPFQRLRQFLLSALLAPDLHGCMQAHCPVLPASPTPAPALPMMFGGAA